MSTSPLLSIYILLFPTSFHDLPNKSELAVPNKSTPCMINKCIACKPELGASTEIFHRPSGEVHFGVVLVAPEIETHYLRWQQWLWWLEGVKTGRQKKEGWVSELEKEVIEFIVSENDFIKWCELFLDDRQQPQMGRNKR